VRALVPKGPHKVDNRRTFEIMVASPMLCEPVSFFLARFDEIERALDLRRQAAEGMPPYNIERMPRKMPARTVFCSSPGPLRASPATTRHYDRGTAAGDRRAGNNYEQTPAYLPPAASRPVNSTYFVLARRMEVLVPILRMGSVHRLSRRPEARSGW